MRVMVVVKATPQSETGVMPEDPSMFIEMGKFNDELIAAGVMLDGAGLKASKYAKRLTFSGKKAAVTDGPSRIGNANGLCGPRRVRSQARGVRRRRSEIHTGSARRERLAAGRRSQRNRGRRVAGAADAERHRGRGGAQCGAAIVDGGCRHRMTAGRETRRREGVGSRRVGVDQGAVDPEFHTNHCAAGISGCQSCEPVHCQKMS